MGLGRSVVGAGVALVALVVALPATTTSANAGRRTAPLPAPLVAGDLTDPTSYPATTSRGIKAVQPDFWPDRAEIAGQVGRVPINFFWAEWQPTDPTPPCAAGDQEYDGSCFHIPQAVDAEVLGYSQLGVPATGILYGTPAWARGTRPCTPVAPGFEVFCVPDDPQDYARFVGFIAHRYDGASGNGRVSDFVIQNEVNTNQWFDVGCGQGTACPIAPWIHEYAAIYDAAYDQVRAAQPAAHVLFSFTQHFEPVFDRPAIDQPVLSIQTFMRELVPLVGDRTWYVAVHPYPKVAFPPVLDARDLPVLTLGNVGTIVGWLHARYPRSPAWHEVELTEQGLNDPDGRYDAEQADGLCQAFRNVLGTPGITSFVYHRMLDHPDEHPLALGLRTHDGTPKPALSVWTGANDPAHPRCGFEHPDHTVISRGAAPGSGREWVTSRTLPKGYRHRSAGWVLDSSVGPGTAMLWECGQGDATWLERGGSCAGATPMGPVGAIRLAPAAGDVALYRYDEVRGSGVGSSTSQRVTTAAGCQGAGRPVLLGYVAGEVLPCAEPADGAVSTTVATPQPGPPPAIPVDASPAFTG